MCVWERLGVEFGEMLRLCVKLRGLEWCAYGRYMLVMWKGEVLCVKVELV